MSYKIVLVVILVPIVIIGLIHFLYLWIVNTPPPTAENVSRSLANRLMQDAATANLVCNDSRVLRIVHPDFKPADFARSSNPLADYGQSPFPKIQVQFSADRKSNGRSFSGTATAHIEGRGVDEQNQTVLPHVCVADISFQYMCDVADNGASAAMECNLTDIHVITR